MSRERGGGTRSGALSRAHAAALRAMRNGLALCGYYKHLVAYRVCAELGHDILEHLLIFLEEASELLVVILQL